jgi:phage host-nuclease inhibitor protein Gam
VGKISPEIRAAKPTTTKEIIMTKRQKLEPCIIGSRAALEAVVADVVKLKLEHTQATASMEQEIADVQKKHQENLLGLARQIEAREAGVFVYCQKNRAVLFPEKKSLDLLLATVGFELTPPRVEKLNGKDTFGKIGLRLEGLDWGGAYVRYPDPEVNKEKILADRAQLKAEQLQEAGLKIDQDENFFLRPKSEVAGQSVREAA